ncbi:E3 ubiquitin-protein ligase RNF220 isoform X1 [Talpa occidentalis]|uniref:E3 ubiquitin-protein ligase RNF220 isoform X1 n=1 Tax=Talpa occidentalis TaxID=50954 RepID=UPI0023F7567F|nr:E3 ubiquitin-protein ligase RNF220 isoform X1 [Talpa occidentalis]
MDLHRAAFKMENSSYLPNPLASPALMVLASTAEASRDASIPCQQPRPFGVPVSVDKDVHIPFTNGSYTFASMYHRQDADGKEYDFGTQLPSSSPGSLKVDDTGKKIFAVSGLISDREASSSPEDRNDRCKKKAAALFDSQAPICPICQVLLRPSELQEHMEQELEQLAQLPTSKNSLLKDAMAPGTPKSLLLSASIKREGESPTASPHSSATDDLHHSDRYQTFLRVRANRQTRLNARIGKMKRRKQDEGQVCPLCSRPLAGSEQEMSRHVEHCLSKREGSCMAEDDTVDIEHENSNRFEEYEWCGQKRIRATTLLEGGFRGSGFVMCSGKENPDSDADLDVDGDDTLEYGKPQYTEADVIPCTGEEPGEAKEREALRGAVLNGGPPSTRITPEFSKWASDEMPSTSNGESSKQEAMQKTCKNSDIEKITEDSAVTTFEALKARVRELERQLSRGDRYKCLICMDSYSMPLTSIQCWHVHCEECWLRTLGAKKLCPQCNTITAPGDLRRIYL